MAEPQSGEIADSLGWAYYHMGDYKGMAVQHLERAVTLPTRSARTSTITSATPTGGSGARPRRSSSGAGFSPCSPRPSLKAAVEKKLTSGLDVIAAPAAVAQQ